MQNTLTSDQCEASCKGFSHNLQGYILLAPISPFSSHPPHQITTLFHLESKNTLNQGVYTKDIYQNVDYLKAREILLG